MSLAVRWYHNRMWARHCDREELTAGASSLVSDSPVVRHCCKQWGLVALILAQGGGGRVLASQGRASSHLLPTLEAKPPLHHIDPSPPEPLCAPPYDLS